MESDGGLVQHIEDAGGPVAHSPGQLHSLPFPGGKSGRGAVKSQVSQPQVQKSPGRWSEKTRRCFPPWDAFLPGGKRAHLQPISQDQTSVIRQASSREIPCSLGALAASDRRLPLTVRAGIFFQKFFHPLHALLVFYF